MQLPLKGLSTTFGGAPASQKLFGLNSTNIAQFSSAAIERRRPSRARSFSQAHAHAAQPTHQIIEIVHGATAETPKTVGPSVAGGAIGQQTGAASADAGPWRTRSTTSSTARR